MIGYHSRGQQRAVTKNTLVLESAFGFGSDSYHSITYYTGVRQVTVANFTTSCAANIKLKIAPISSCFYKALIYEIFRTISRA